MKLQHLKLNHLDLSTSLKNKNGFTLIESAIAMVVLLIGVFAVIQFFPLGLQIIGNSQERTAASSIAIAQLETVRSQSYDDISTGTIETKARVSSDPSSYLYDYQRETTVEFVDSDFNTSVTDVGLKKITVTTYWMSPLGNQERSTNISTVISSF